ncbi:MAG: lipo-like protein [Betaproteobacteria bacterium]|nr:lipo-like protein [Betaproteobacteria bacterium]
MERILGGLGRRLARFLSRSVRPGTASRPSDPTRLLDTLRPGDVLLVEGDTRLSTAIKYLTQSTWSHAALFVGDALGGLRDADGICNLVEVDLTEGVHARSLSDYARLHTRICRPVGLSPQEVTRLVEFMVSRIGYRYDLRNIVDLARYLLPTPPVPVRWRRRLLALGSGDPTRAICSSLIAQAFQSLRYPILPHVDLRRSDAADCDDCLAEILRIRHHSLFTPRDFDVSPYFAIVKPTLDKCFDFRALTWSADAPFAELPSSVRIE